MSPPNGQPPSESNLYKVPDEECNLDEKNDQLSMPANCCTDDISNSDSEPEATVVVPPDGGWGWMVVIASFCCNMIVDGIIFSFGIFKPSLSEEFQVSTAGVSLMGSLLSGFYLIAGPFVSAIANKYGFRLVGILGAILGSAAFVLSAFGDSIEYLCISYGVIGGIGFGLIYVPAVITVGFYFERWRALATGIAVCGSGIGTFLFAPLSSWLIERLGWRGTLLVQAALVLSCALFAAMFRPIKPVRITVKLSSESDTSEQMKDGKNTPEKRPLVMKLKIPKDIETEKTSSLLSVNSICKPKLIKTNSCYPTAEDAFTKSALNINASFASLHKNDINNQTPSIEVTTAIDAKKRMSIPMITENIKFASGSLNKLNGDTKPGKENPICVPLLLNEDSSENSERRRTISGLSRKVSLVSQTVPSTTIRSRRVSHASINTTDSDVQRPFYRDDIFFGASLQRLPQYTSHTSLGYHMTVTRLPTKEDVQEEKENKCKLCPVAVTRTLRTMLDWSLLKSPSFLILSVSGALTMMGFYVPFVFLVDRATLYYGMDLELAIRLVSTIGITNTIGRVLCGVMSSIPGMNALIINNIAITIGGVATMLSGWSSSNEYQFFYAAVFGLSISCFASLRSILVVDLLGIEKLTNAFGLLLLFQGLAAVVGSPIAGAFMDATGSYDMSFYFSGFLMTLSAIMCYPLNYINKWERRRNEEKSVCNV